MERDCCEFICGAPAIIAKLKIMAEVGPLIMSLYLSLNIFYFNKCHFYTDLIYTYSIGLERKLTLIWFFSLK